MAFLKKTKLRKNGETYEYWRIVESVRTESGPRHRTIAWLGKEPGIDKEEKVGWEEITRELSGKERSGFIQGDLFSDRSSDSLCKPDWATIDLSQVRVERLRRFGDVYLALILWRRMGLDRFFKKRMNNGKEEIPWRLMACLLCVARFCEPSSELSIAESWYQKTALDDLLGIDVDKVNPDRLYRTLDQLLEHREELFGHFKKLYGEMFGEKYDILFYDVTSTYFEGMAEKNDLAFHGYSRDKRFDCRQVCIGLVASPEGFPLAFEVFAGNRADVTTLEEIVELMERKYGKARRVWVVDRGIVSEANLAMLRRHGADYICGTPRSMLKKYEEELLSHSWEQVQEGVEVKIVKAPSGEDEQGEHDPGGRETFILCRSKGRMEKDRAIVKKAADRLQSHLEKLQKSIISGRVKNRTVAERRVGRLFGKYWRASRLFRVKISDGKNRLYMEIHRNNEAEEWLSVQNGCYLLRTNRKVKDAAELWRAYIGLVRVEDAFRQLKSPLELRPVYHQRSDRVQSHIMVCFIALAMREVLSQWMKASGLGNAVDTLKKEFSEIRSLDVVLKAKQKTQIRLRVVSTPEQSTRILLHHLNLKVPNRPKKIQNVVPKTGV